MIPRWGFYNGIKYSPRRSLLKTCGYCKRLFLQYNKGKRRYCNDVCSANARRKQMKYLNKKILKTRDKFQHKEDERLAYAKGLRSKNRIKIGSYRIPKPKLNEDGEPDWTKYHETLNSTIKSITTLYANQKVV